MGNYIYYGYTSVRRTVTLEPTVKKVDTATSVKEISRPDCEITTLEKVTVITAPVVKEEPKMEEQKNVEMKEVKKVEEEKEEVKEVEEEKEEKEEVKEVEKVMEVKEEVEEKKEVEEVKEVKEVKEVNEVKEVKEVKEVEEKKEVKEIKEKIVIEWKSATKVKEKSPLLAPIKEESMDVHPYLLEYGTNPIKSNTLLIQNQTYQVNSNKKKNKKKD